ncbi:LAME_0B07052g1_1 [Lachancea meyersii CBS 8951]|uniref:LAME_0B07052g1_1 n=1 Tax=Lachancea meyersii CBS 8951 TaxID=1266667 RepID=A0A1G4IX27_9SACH|nr:LAME_0B07052g1_1 [Lachancea meyersii CBS 8951]
MIGVFGRLAANVLKPRVSTTIGRSTVHTFQGHRLSTQSAMPLITLLKPILPMEPNTATEEMFTDSVMRKRRLKMKKHKLRKRRKRQKAEKRKQSQGK